MAKTGGPTPSEILTKAALRNASVVLQATSGSTNALVHLAAIAGRAGITYDLAELDRVGRADARCCSISSPPAPISWRTSMPAAACRRCGGG